MFYITNQSHHWKLNQSDDRIQCPSTNQKAGYKKKQPITAIAITDFSYISPWLIPSSFIPNSYDVLLREMRQAVYREEKPDQASKDSCRFFTDLQLQYLWRRVQSTRPQKEAWSGPQIQLDLRSMRSVFQQNWHPSAPSCPTWENGVATDTEVLSDDSETRALYIQYWQSIRIEEATGNRVQDREHPQLPGEALWVLTSFPVKSPH